LLSLSQEIPGLIVPFARERFRIEETGDIHAKVTVVSLAFLLVHAVEGSGGILDSLFDLQEGTHSV
jgi:hypothetical protein